jgi:hypothetical protein
VHGQSFGARPDPAVLHVGWREEQIFLGIADRGPHRAKFAPSEPVSGGSGPIQVGKGSPMRLTFSNIGRNRPGYALSSGHHCERLELMDLVGDFGPIGCGHAGQG